MASLRWACCLLQTQAEFWLLLIRLVITIERKFSGAFWMSSVVGMVVEDCLLLLLNLLKNNVSNQNYLKEGSYIQRLPLCLDIEYSDRPDGDLWSAQKVTNVHLMLEVWLFGHLFTHSLISFTHSLISFTHSLISFMLLFYDHWS